MFFFRYSIFTSVWENFLPIWKNENDMYITPDSNSNPIIYYVKWVVGKSVGTYDATIMNDVYVDGVDHCPYSMDQWKYEWEYNWYEDSTLKFSCVKWKNRE